MELYSPHPVTPLGDGGCIPTSRHSFRGWGLYSHIPSPPTSRHPSTSRHPFRGWGLLYPPHPVPPHLVTPSGDGGSIPTSRHPPHLVTPTGDGGLLYSPHPLTPHIPSPPTSRHLPHISSTLTSRHPPHISSPL